MERTVVAIANTRIVLACKKCGTEISYDVTSWEKDDTRCPKCGAVDQNRIESFREALRAVVDNRAQLPFDVMIEVRR